ncbi:hypothetical protein HMSSN036_96630 [Paenibacillus macerans]|nr:hypothetical protein HMSSN036_96630 [Paenibacillus macerans]
MAVAVTSMVWDMGGMAAPCEPSDFSANPRDKMLNEDSLIAAKSTKPLPAR